MTDAPRCPVCGATDHEQGPPLYGMFPVILCPEIEEHRIVLAPRRMLAPVRWLTEAEARAKYGAPPE